MASVAIHPPKTPVTKGSNSISAATVPNVCKMPGPPAPFVPTPLPNIGRSSIRPSGYSKTVKIEGQYVAILGASFGSIGDIASKGTGGGILSNNCEGPTKFIAPGSLTVQIQGKNVHLLGDVMSNNNGPAGAPPNAATLNGTVHAPALVAKILQDACCACDAEVQPGPYDSCATLGERKHACCEEKLMMKKGAGGERGYKSDGSDFTNGSRARMAGESYPSFKGRIRGSAWPDACALDSKGNPSKFYDFKFGCPKDVPRWVGKDGTKGPLAGGLSRPGIGAKQERKYRRLAKQLGMADQTPQAISNRDCP
jgi:uncharacterized Zn-binding protein involved in type VI secretion